MSDLLSGVDFAVKLPSPWPSPRCGGEREKNAEVLFILHFQLIISNRQPSTVVD